jgi:hypothetical protein
MNRHIIGLYALALAAGAALLSACSANGTAGSSPLPDVRRSWVDAVPKSQALLYVSDIATNLVDIFTYPSGAKVGSLSGFGAVAGLCSDKAGDIFVVDEAGPVQMFAHGGTSAIRKLTTTGAPYGCAVDPVTGNLALTNLSSYLYGALDIYPKAKGSPKQYNDPSQIDSTYFCAYDSSGNLYIDGWDRSAKFIFIKLPKGGKSLGVTELNLKTSSPAGVQWDGTYVAMGDKGTGHVYRVTTSGAIKGTVALKGGTNVMAFWLDGSTLIGPNFSGGGPVGVWKYPAGGSPTKTIKGSQEPFAATLSL